MKTDPVTPYRFTPGDRRVVSRGLPAAPPSRAPVTRAPAAVMRSYRIRIPAHGAGNHQSTRIQNMSRNELYESLRSLYALTARRGTR